MTAEHLTSAIRSVVIHNSNIMTRSEVECMVSTHGKVSWEEANDRLIITAANGSIRISLCVNRKFQELADAKGRMLWLYSGCATNDKLDEYCTTFHAKSVIASTRTSGSFCKI